MRFGIGCVEYGSSTERGRIKGKHIPTPVYATWIGYTSAEKTCLRPLLMHTSSATLDANGNDAK